MTEVLAQSIGFDRDLFWEINLNLQVNQSIILFYDEITSVDIQADDDITSTRITAAISREFFREKLKIETIVMGDIESNAYLVIPALTWTEDTLSYDIKAGIFVGKEEGLFGQFRDNSFLNMGVTYTF